MDFDWHEYLNLAKQLAGNPAGSLSDAESRSSVSRAYYSMFHLALASAEGFRGSGTGEDHVALQKHWERGQRANVGIWLGDMHGWRIQCDYEDEVENLRAMVGLALNRAERILKILPAPK